MRCNIAVLHATYSQTQLKEVLSFLQTVHENLYLCCLISYGCFLRPHIEVRNLKGSHFKADFTEIHLSGNENKSGRVRIVAIPDYVREQIIDRCRELSNEDNLFSLNPEPFNEYYFKTAWTRCVIAMRKLGIIEHNQTMYSFRHTAAVNVYRETKDLHLLQQLLGHSNMIVTLKYLRGLGVHNVSELRQVMPKL
jgi:integrase